MSLGLRRASSTRSLRRPEIRTFRASDLRSGSCPVSVSTRFDSALNWSRAGRCSRVQTFALTCRRSGRVRVVRLGVHPRGCDIALSVRQCRREIIDGNQMLIKSVEVV